MTQSWRPDELSNKYLVCPSFSKMKRGGDADDQHRQEFNWSPVYGSDDFWLFCQNVTNPDAPENITQIDYALSEYTNGEPWTNLGNYANYVKENIIPMCDGAPIDSTACFGTQNRKQHLTSDHLE